MEQFYATLLLEDDKASLQVDESNDDKPTTLPVCTTQYMHTMHGIQLNLLL